MLLLPLAGWLVVLLLHYYSYQFPIAATTNRTLGSIHRDSGIIATKALGTGIFKRSFQQIFNDTHTHCLNEKHKVSVL
jgi:hypothetical protein